MWVSEKVGRMPILPRLTFIGLISLADDEGRGRGDPRFMLGAMHAYSKDISEQSFLACLNNIEKERLAAFYVVDGAHYYALPGWKEHQYIEKPKTSKIPPVPEHHPMAKLFIKDADATSRGRVGDEEGNNPPRKGREGKGREGKGLTTAKSSPSAVDFSEYRLNIGKYKGAYVRNIPADEAAFLIRTVKRIGKTERAALEWRVSQKIQEMTPEQRKSSPLSEGVGHGINQTMVYPHEAQGQ